MKKISTPNYHSISTCCLLLISLLAAMPGGLSQIELEVTELFPGQSGTDLTADWFEIRNTGAEPWIQGVNQDLYYDDESADPADAVPIMGLTDLQPGEYAIILITEDELDLTVFSLVWDDVTPLTGLKIGYADGSGLGGSGDAVNVWLGDPLSTDPIASADYPDTDLNDGQSWDAEIGAFSSVGNTSGAVETRILGGSDGNTPNIGSPGNTGPFPSNPNAPSLVLDRSKPLPLIHFISDRSAVAAAEIGDDTDPLIVQGLPLSLNDNNTLLSDIDITLSSDATNVVPDSNIILNGSDSAYLLRIEPIDVGYATLTLTATDPEGNTGSFRLYVAVSDAADSPRDRFHAGASDASTGIHLDSTRMWVGDDEDQTLRLFDRYRSGSAIRSIDFNEALGSDDEVDIEGSVQRGDSIFWMGSHTNGERGVIFRTLQTTDSLGQSLVYDGQYRSMREDLIEWDRNGDHGMGAGFFNFETSFEIEALSSNPTGPGALLGFRAPVINGFAILVPVNNFFELPTTDTPQVSAEFGNPILVDLQGGSFRSLHCNSEGCIIIAGPAGTTQQFRMWTWNGEASDEPDLRDTDLTSIAEVGSIEGVLALSDIPDFTNAGSMDSIQLIVDAGTFDYYGDGNEAKDLPLADWKKARSVRVSLGSVIVPPVATPGEVVITEIMQNPSATPDSLGEWIEIYNNTSRQFDLRNWTLTDAEGDTISIESDSSVILEPGAFATLGNESDTALNGGIVHSYTYEGGKFGLDDNEDQIMLIGPDGIVVDSLAWGMGTNFPIAEGASVALEAPQLDNANGENWCISSQSFGKGDAGTPGEENDCINTTQPDLQITEIWPGQQGSDVTEDWFEITNFGSVPWVAGSNAPLFYDDESQDPTDAVEIAGLNQIDPGQSAIVIVGGASDAQEFRTVWNEVYDIETIEIGWADGSGLGQGGDGVSLFLGQPSPMNLLEFASYPAAPSGLSYDLVIEAFSAQGEGIDEIGTNIAVATAVTGGSNGDEPAIASPGNLGPLNPPGYELIITELHPGQNGSDLTEDWFEIKNIGNAPWEQDSDPILYYDDDSQDPGDAVPISGIDQIRPDEVVLIVLDNDTSSIASFREVWEPVIDLSGIQIGLADGSGLGSGGDAATLWIGDPLNMGPADTASYPDTEGFDGQSWDVTLQAFSEVGNASGAVATVALGGDDEDVPNIGSPGDGRAVPPSNALRITELFPGQSGDDLTEDWFEISNQGTEDWVAAVDAPLYYDDESQDPADAVRIEGIARLNAGATAMVILTNDTVDVNQFRSVWEEVIDLSGVAIGYADGSGLGGGGDAATLWLGDPFTTAPTDTASYPDTDGFDGQSWDVTLQAFSEVGNTNGAVSTIQLGGDNQDVPNIGSPGNGLAVPPASGLKISELFPGQSGDDLTEDWFEIINEGSEDYIEAMDGPLFYDDESQDPGDAVVIQGIDRIEAGATAIVVLTNDTADVNQFLQVWQEVTDLSDVPVGFADGSGLGGGGDAATLWIEDPERFLFIDTASYPDTDGFDARSWDVALQSFSTVGNANDAVATLQGGGDGQDVPNIGSPGNKGPIVAAPTIQTESKGLLYPNPATEVLYYESPAGEKPVEMKILKLNGQIARELPSPAANPQRIPIQHLPSGKYLLNVKNRDGKMEFHLFIKQ